MAAGVSGLPRMTVHVPGPLRELTGGRGRLHFEARTVDEVLERIRETEPLLAGRLFADDGSVRHYINLFLNGSDLRHLDTADRTVSRDSVLSIVPSVAGG
ncbi:MAG: MoaD/ThiS family protein [Gemmatimonadetes bacterium]|nr:MoaD/ThiS family protein [Gemmatimonadota bacterium]